MPTSYRRQHKKQHHRTIFNFTTNVFHQMTCQHSALHFFTLFSRRLISLPRNIFQFMCRIRRKPFWWSEIKSISYTERTMLGFAENSRLTISTGLATNWKNPTWHDGAKRRLRRLWRGNINIISVLGIPSRLPSEGKDVAVNVIRKFEGITSMMCICMKIKCVWWDEGFSSPLQR